MLVPPGGERIVEVDQLFGQLVKPEKFFRATLDFKPGRFERPFSIGRQSGAGEGPVGFVP